MDEKKFKKVMGTKDVLVVAFGAMIGWGWVVSSGGWIQKAGVAGTVLAFILGGLMIYFVGLAYAELTAAMPECGGGHIFSLKAMGRKGSFVCTWAIILSYVGVVCFEACSLPTVLQYIFPGFLKGYLYTICGFDVYATWLAVAVISAILITCINICGVKVAATLQTVLTLTIGAAGLLLVAASCFTGTASNFAQQLLVGEGPDAQLKNILSVAVIAPFYLFGFDVIPQAAEEINVPPKKLGRLLILSIAMAVSFYALVVLAIGYVMSADDVARSISGAGLVTADAMSKAFNSIAMAKVLILGGICGIITSWNSFLIGGSRAICSMAESKMIPDFLAQIDKKTKTPVNAIILIGLLSSISPLLGREMLTWISNTASFACCVTYCMVSVSFLILRKKQPEMDRPYKVKNGIVCGILAVGMSGTMALLYLIPCSGCTLTNTEWGIVGVWVVLGILLAAGRKHVR